jgi:hypothetical protein
MLLRDGRLRDQKNVNSPLFEIALVLVRLKGSRPHRKRESQHRGAWFKALAKKLHPDHGGIDEEMKELLHLREKMKNTWLRL